MSLTEKTRQYISHGLLLSSQICFSGWHIVGSLSMKDGASPFVFALYREVFAATMMFLIVYFTNKRIYIHPEDRRRFLCLGFFSFVNVVGAMLSLQYISATRFAIFQPCIPCIAVVISVFKGLEPFTWIKLLGIMLAVSGAIITEAWKDSGSSNDDDEKDITLGTIIVSIQVTGMACLVVFAKPVLPRYSPQVTTLVYYSIGTVMTMILFAILSFTLTAGDLYFNGSLLPWLALAYASTFATVYTYNALSWGGRHLSPSITTVYSTFQPVGTMILSFIILAKMVTTPELIGGAMVILGLVITVYGQNYDNIMERKTSAENEPLTEKFVVDEDALLVTSPPASRNGSSNPTLSENPFFTPMLDNEPRSGSYYYEKLSDPSRPSSVGSFRK